MSLLFISAAARKREVGDSSFDIAEDILVEIKVNSKESLAKAKTKTLEDKGTHIKTDHLEKLPKPNNSHADSTAAAKPEALPLTSNTRASKQDGHPKLKLIGAKSKNAMGIILKLYCMLIPLNMK